MAVLLVTTAILGFVLYTRLIIPKILPVPEQQMNLALSGVQANAEWEPVLRSFGGVDMLLVPTGCFQKGTTLEQLEEAIASCNSYYGAFGCQQSFENEQPAHQVCLTQPYWLDQIPVTNAQYWLLTLGSPDSAYPDLNLPVQSITWQQAADYCEMRNARLPTEAEWEFAARGPDGLIYPFGNEYDINLVTLRKISPPPAAQIPEGASWVGAMDMSGGMGEWVADWYGLYSADPTTDPSGPANGDLRIVRGGTWFAHAAYFVRTTFREPLPPETATSSYGFRCVRSIPPLNFFRRIY
ncbi:MAG: formylglycine-generating enzyme family protein [Chloroflexi bacterium]|nr:formylglycine-generating enzyme family protein [Chloroflexota bacterium]